MYSRRADSEIFYDRRESIGSLRPSSSSSRSSLSDGSSSSDHYNPTLRLLKIPRSSNGSMGFHLTRSKWDPYPWISAVDVNTPAKFHGLKAGECVLEVNGEDVLGLRISEIANLVNSETETIDSVALLLWSPGSDIKCNPRNLCCGPMPLNLERLTACTQTILAIIECPVCLETIAPPTLQCQNGHILCVKCRILSHTCPVCRQHFYPGRSLVAEQIYNSITDTFNLRSQDKLHNGEQLFGAKYKRSPSSATTTIERYRREKQQHHGICLKPSSQHEVNKFASQPPSTNTFLAKLLGRAYSMDNLSLPRRQSASLLSLTRRITIGTAGDDEDNFVEGKSKANSFNDYSDEQLELENLFKLCCRPARPPDAISKQFSLSAHNLSKKDNDRIIAIQHESLLKDFPRHLWRERNLAQMALLPISPSPAGANSVTTLGPRKISVGCEYYLKNDPPTEQNIQMSCCIETDSLCLCPFGCGKQFRGPDLQQHVKVDHCAPILCYNSSSAELALPLRAPLDKAAVLLMCDDKDFWIKLRTHGNGSITALAIFQGPEDESSNFMMETRLRIRIEKDQDEVDNDDIDEDDDDDENDEVDDDYVKIVVNNSHDGILEQELITRSIVRSMMVTTFEDTRSNVSGDENDLRREGFLYNRIAFEKATHNQNLLLKIIIKRRKAIVASGSDKLL